MTRALASSVENVSLADRSYDIHIGDALLEQAGDLLAPLLRRKKTVIVTDQNVAYAQLPRLAGGLEKRAIEFQTIVLDPGESTKSFRNLEFLTSQLLALGVEREDLIIALGGGVVGDITGFAAAVLRRGCRYAQAPTTLLAQVDSSVGGKTAINAAAGKNLIGAFHQPAIVIADIGALGTLPLRDLKAGYGEVVKYGAIIDEGFFGWLEANGAGLLKGDVAARQHAVKVSCAAKARIVGQDEKEHGRRALLNFGHTFGHAFEAIYGYSDALMHGEAVALGMALAFDYSVRLGLCPSDTAKRFRKHLRDSGLTVDIGRLPPVDGLTSERIVSLMMQDKKVRQGALTLILARGVGNAVILNDAPVDDVRLFLEETVAGETAIRTP